MRSIFAQLVGLIIASLIFLVLFPPSSGLLGVLWVIGFFVAYAIIGGMIDSLLENIFTPPEKQRGKIIKEVLSKPPATDTIPPVKTINNITEPKYYTAEELAKDFSRGRVVDSRIPPSLKGYYDAIKSQNEKTRIINTTGYRKITPEQIRAMDWREFESFIANMFVEQGYKTTLTPETQDGGKDVIAEKDGITYYIECKHWKDGSIIGRELLQKLVGAAVANGVNHVIFIATCQYNSNAIAYAKQVNKNGFDIRLWGINDIIKFHSTSPSIIRLEKIVDNITTITRASFVNVGTHIAEKLSHDVDMRFKKFTSECNSHPDLAKSSFGIKVRYESTDYLSLSYMYFFFRERAAHGYYYSNDIVYNKTTGEVIPLSFFLNITLEQLQNYVQNNQVMYNIYDKIILKSEPPQYVSQDYYLLDDNGLALTYPPYKLSCYSDGIVTVRFTYSKITEYNILNCK